MIRRLTQPKPGKAILAFRPRDFAARILARYGFIRGRRQGLSLVFLQRGPRDRADSVFRVWQPQSFWSHSVHPVTLIRQTVLEKAPVQQNQTVLLNAIHPVTQIWQTVPGKTPVWRNQTVWLNAIHPVTKVWQTAPEKTRVRQNQAAWAPSVHPMVIQSHRVQERWLIGQNQTLGFHGLRPMMTYLPADREKAVIQERGSVPAHGISRWGAPPVPVAGLPSRTEVQREQRTLWRAEIANYRYEERRERAGAILNQRQRLLQGPVGVRGGNGWAVGLKTLHSSRIYQRMNPSIAAHPSGFTGAAGNPERTELPAVSPEPGTEKGWGGLAQPSIRPGSPSADSGTSLLKRNGGLGEKGLSPRQVLFRTGMNPTRLVNRGVRQLNSGFQERTGRVVARQGQQERVQSGDRLTGRLPSLPASLADQRPMGRSLPAVPGVLPVRQTHFQTIYQQIRLALQQQIIPDRERVPLPEVSDEPGVGEVPAVTLTVREALREPERLAETIVGVRERFTTVRIHDSMRNPGHSLPTTQSRLVFQSRSASDTQPGAVRIRPGEFTRTAPNHSGTMPVFPAQVYANPAEARFPNALTATGNQSFRRLPPTEGPGVGFPERVFHQPQAPQQRVADAVKQGVESNVAVPAAAEPAEKKETLVSEREMERITATVFRRLERKIAVEKDRRGLF